MLVKVITRDISLQLGSCILPTHSVIPDLLHPIVERQQILFGASWWLSWGHFRPLFLLSPSQAVPTLWLRCWIVFAVSHSLYGTTTEPWY